MRAVHVVLAVCLLVASGTSVGNCQQGTPDQAVDVATTESLGIGSPPEGLRSLFQSFRPSASPLSEITLRLQPGAEFPAAGASSTIRIRKAAVDGEVLAEATAPVPPAGVTGPPIVIFTLDEPVEVTADDPYVIEWIAPEAGDTVLKWLVAADDPYADGTAFGADGKPLEGRDFVFSTFTGAAAAGGAQRSMTEVLEEGQQLLAAQDFSAAMARFRRVLELAGERGELTGDDWYAAGTAHYYLMAEAFDKALEGGGLDGQQAAAAKEWRDAVYAPAAAVDTAVVKVIGHGEQVNLAEHLAAGKTTIFDFYSEYCPPCRQISPKLEALAKDRDDIVVVKVDINRPGIQGIDWASPVAKQYGLQSIPHFKVYGPNGNLQGEGDAAYNWVIQQVQNY